MPPLRSLLPRHRRRRRSRAHLRRGAFVSTTSGAPQADLVFGVVAFPPADKAKATASFRAPHFKGVRRWVRSVRQATSAAQTQLLLFTSEGAGALTADAAMARWLAEQRVAVEYGDFADAPSRGAHGAPEKFIWCVMRNRWFVIADYLERHAGRFRYVLMTDVRDVVLQADPFAAALAKNLVDGSQSTVVFSGEGAGRVKQLRDSKKGKPRTLDCAGPAPLRAPERQKLLATEPLNAGVTLGGAAAFRNFSRDGRRDPATTSAACVGIKDCTDQGCTTSSSTSTGASTCTRGACCCRPSARSTRSAT